MKPAIVGLLAFVVSTAAASGAKVALTPPPAPVVADSTKPHKDKDSTQTDTALVASGEAGTPPTDTARRTAVVPDTTKGPAGATPAPVALVTQGGLAALAARAATATAEVAASDTLRQASERRVAKVFTSMDAKQAAKVLDKMTDGDVQIILGYVGPKQAAAILAALPPDRVATLSKLAMQGKK